MTTDDFGDARPFLPHASDDCIGEWRLVGSRGSGAWRCSVCGREHPSTPANDAASDREYARGVQLRSQARQGRLLDFLRSATFRGLFLEIPEPPDEGDRGGE